jgi:hypothetical protein
MAIRPRTRSWPITIAGMLEPAPSPVATLLDGERDRHRSFLAISVEGAVVDDLSREFAGTDAIRQWSDRESSGKHVNLKSTPSKNNAIDGGERSGRRRRHQRSHAVGADGRLEDDHRTRDHEAVPAYILARAQMRDSPPRAATHLLLAETAHAAHRETARPTGCSSANRGPGSCKHRSSHYSGDPGAAAVGVHE